MPNPKGHWTRGKRRNAHPDWEGLRLQLLHLFEVAYRVRYCTPGALAKDLEVDRHTVAKWLSGEDWPSVGYIPKLKKWLRLRMPREE